MGWLGGKSAHEKQVHAAATVWSNFYLTTTEGGASAPLVLQPGVRDFRLRYMMFCLSTMQTACARRMRNPDAVLNDLLQTIVQGGITPGNPLFFGGNSDPQQTANEAAAYLQDYLHRWSSWVDISSGGNRGAATGIVCSMLKHAESADPATAADGPRLWPLATWVEAQLDIMANAFVSMAR